MEIILIIAAALLLWGIIIYNSLVRDRNRVAAAWSDIDVQLKRRHDLIPKLTEVVRQYAAYEQATLTAVTELRTRGSTTKEIAARSAIEHELGQKIQKLLAVAEQYPALKASENFLDLQSNLSDVEDHIQYARRYYNGAVKNLNVRIQSFPDMLIAKLFRYIPATYFDLDDSAS